MADTKISALASATTPLAGTELVPLVQSGTTVKTTVTDILGGVLGTAAYTAATAYLAAGATAVNSSLLLGATWAAPAAIGTGTPAAVTGTTITANTGFVGPLNGIVGGGTPAAGTFTTVNKLTLTTPATGSTLTILDGKTLTVSNILTLAGTDSTTMTFPTTSATIARTDAANTFVGTQTIPGVNFTGTTIPTNGTFLPGANQLGFATNGALRMTLEADGTLNPSFILTERVYKVRGVTASVANGASVDIATLTNYDIVHVSARNTGNTSQYVQAIVYVNGAGGVSITTLVTAGITVTSSGADKLSLTNGTGGSITMWFSVFRQDTLS